MGNIKEFHDHEDTISEESREEMKRERERDNFIEITRTHDDTCTNTNYNEGLCGLLEGDLR